MTFSAPKSVSLEALYRGRGTVMPDIDSAFRDRIGQNLVAPSARWLQCSGLDPERHASSSF
ncbi:MAG: hypothetical protein F4Y60_01495 [Boseongicola sp. SB0664_bin_43]|uniref:Uncharacterized protein n=1 Tax=Boseongicola sp. SB0664_bin_43 TaxID=2604844 RepID=A0A6B0XYD8_9RHOB|nr:hypothetical protein [Boseongicola sp. SB0664_bin_43]